MLHKQRCWAHNWGEVVISILYFWGKWQLSFRTTLEVQRPHYLIYGKGRGYGSPQLERRCGFDTLYWEAEALNPRNWRGEEALLAHKMLTKENFIPPQTPKIGFSDIMMPTGKDFVTLQIPEGGALIPQNS